MRATLERVAGCASRRRYLGLAAALINRFGPFHAADRALPVVLEIGVVVRLWAALRRRRTAAQSPGATAPGHATLKAGVQTDQAAPLLSRPHGRMGPARGTWSFENAVSACGCNSQIKFHPGSWDATGRQ